MDGVSAGMAFRFSTYTHFLQVTSEDVAIYNGRTGSIIRVSRNASERCQAFRRESPDDCSAIDHDSLFPHLLAGGFVVESGFDELQAIREQFYQQREQSQFLLTILPTFQCNLACSYCFIDKKTGVLSREQQDQIIVFATERSRGVLSMSVDWFGGEPLLGLSVIDYLSASFQDICQARGIPYSAQVITNGTMMSDENVKLLLRSGVNRLQITLDGLQHVNDARRRSLQPGQSSFRQICEGIDRALGKFLIRLRINIDSDNCQEIWPLLDFLHYKGWLGPDTGFFPYLGRVSPFTDACSSVAANACSVRAFQEMNIEWITRLHHLGVPILFQGLYQFPEPKFYNCAAIGNNGFIFNPNGEVHKCGLAVVDSNEAIGRLGANSSTWRSRGTKWDRWTPFDKPKCLECRFLPSCLGGCPRNHVLIRENDKKDNCQYHQEYENQMLLLHLRLAYHSCSNVNEYSSTESYITNSERTALNAVRIPG